MPTRHGGSFSKNDNDRVRRRTFITLLGGAAAWPLAAREQQQPMPMMVLIGAGSHVSDTSKADVVLFVALEGETQCGVLIEIGAALAAGKRVFIVSPYEWTFGGAFFKS